MGQILFAARNIRAVGGAAPTVSDSVSEYAAQAPLAISADVPQPEFYSAERGDRYFCLGRLLRNGLVTTALDGVQTAVPHQQSTTDHLPAAARGTTPEMIRRWTASAEYWTKCLRTERAGIAVV